MGIPYMGVGWLAMTSSGSLLWLPWFLGEQRKKSPRQETCKVCSTLLSKATKVSHGSIQKTLYRPPKKKEYG